jgi:hypothetical protein
MLLKNRVLKEIFGHKRDYQEDGENCKMRSAMILTLPYM